MRKLSVTSVLSGVALAVLISLLALGLFSNSDSTHAQNPVDLGIDMDPYNAGGNVCGGPLVDCTIAQVDKCLSILAPTAGTTFDIDVYVGDPVGLNDLWLGFAGANYDLDFPDTASPANLTMNTQTCDPILGCNPAYNLIIQAVGSLPLVDLSEAVPDVGTPHARGITDFGTGEMSPAMGPFTQGVDTRFQMQIGAGAVPGYYGFSFVPGTAEVLDGFGVGYSGTSGINLLDYNTALPNTHGILALGMPCPVDTDLKKLSLELVPGGWLSWPDYPNAAISEDVGFTLIDTVHNNYGMDPAPAAVVTSITVPAGIEVSHHVSTPDNHVVKVEEVCVDLPSGCGIFPPASTTTVAGPFQTLTVTKYVPVPTSVTSTTVLPQDWDVHCLEPSSHDLRWDNLIEPDGPFIDPEPGNNTAFVEQTVNCTTTADPQVVSQQVIAAPAAKPPLPAPTIYVDTPDSVTILKTLINGSGYSPVEVDVTRTAMIPNLATNYIGMDPVEFPNTCTITAGTPIPQQALTGTATTIPESYTITCGMGGIEFDDDEDAQVDEDPINGVDDDGDCVVGAAPLCAAPYGACTTGAPGCDEDSPFYFVVPVFINTIAEKEAHIVDTNTVNNSDTFTGLTLAVIRDFNPTASFTIDNTAPSDHTVVPTLDNCITGATFPCKTLTSVSIPSSPTNGLEPVAAIMTVKGDTPGEWWQADCNGVVNSETVGFIDFNVVLNVTPMATSCDPGFPLHGTSLLYDAALPNAAPYAGFALGTSSFVVDTDTNVLPVDLYGPGASLIPGPIHGFGVGEFSWSSSLDGVVNLIKSQQANAGLHARYIGVAILTDVDDGPSYPYPGFSPSDTYVPINVLTFDLAYDVMPGAGPFLSIGVTGDPSAPPTSADIPTCTPYSADTITLGVTPNTAQLVQFCVVPNAGIDPYHIATSNLQRLDTGEVETLYDPFTCGAAEDDVSCDLVKTEFPVVGILMDESETVDVHVINGDGPDDVWVEVSITSPLSCPAVWDPATLPTVNVSGAAVAPPTIVDGKQVSIASWQEDGMGAPETRVRPINYIVNCEAGTHELQIMASMGPVNIPDPDIFNNTCNNHPEVTAENPDVDGDTVVNWEDNCPDDINPLQEDFDEDGIGDACDDDIDGDGILNALDDCDFAAEDFDGDEDGDGCPDSDASGIVVDKNHAISFDVSVDHVETVTTTITNGNFGLYAADGNGMLFIELLKSDVSNPDDKCEARWIPQPGDGYVEDVIDGELWSQLEVLVDAPPLNDVSKTRDYVVHCNHRSDHSIFLEESAVPALPVIDPVIDGGNIHKQYITIEAYDVADLKILSYDVHEAPAELRLVEDTDGDSVVDVPAMGEIVLKKVLHNNGPADVGPLGEWDVYFGAPQVPGCDVYFTGVQLVPAEGTLPVSAQLVAFETWIIECSETSDHLFEFENEIVVLAEHVYDDDPSNNEASVSLSIPVIGTGDLTLDVALDPPTEMAVSETEWIDVTNTIGYAGPGSVEPDVEQVFMPTGDNASDCEVSAHVTNDLVYVAQDLEILCCVDEDGDTTCESGRVIEPDTPFGWQVSDVVVCERGEGVALRYQLPLECAVDQVIDVDFDKHCAAPSTHYFKLVTNVTRDAAKDPHVEFQPVSDTQTWDEDVIGESDLKILDMFFEAPSVPVEVGVWKVLVKPSERIYVNEKEVIHNNGPWGPVNVFKTIAATPSEGCSVSYECAGGELIEINDWIVIFDCPAGYDTQAMYPVEYGDHMDVTFYVEDLDVSVNLWQSERWDFHIEPCDGEGEAEPTECTVDFVKTLVIADEHVDDPDEENNSMGKSMIVCADQDEDGVPDSCLGEVDNCTAVFNPDQTDSDGDGVGDACDYQIDLPDLKHCFKFGPAPANLSDNQGRYMWVICEIGNPNDASQTVTVSLDVDGATEVDCLQLVEPELILPGLASFTLTAEEQKWVLFRDRYECHDPAVEGVYPLSVKFCVEFGASPADDDDNDGLFDEDPIDGIDNDGDSLIDEDPPEVYEPVCHEQIRQLIVGPIWP